jgi:hypothetical protein
VTIPDDPLNRWWVEAGGVNPDMVDQYRPTLVSFLAFDRDKRPGLAGTGFVLAGTEQFALVLTARHVLSEGVSRHQRPNSRHVPSSLFAPSSHANPRLSPTDCRATWMSDHTAGMLNVVYAFYAESLDIACCIVMPQDGDEFAPRSIPLDLGDVTVGSPVHMVSLTGHDIRELAPPRAGDGLGQTLELHRTVSIRAGVVTGVFEEGLRHYRWPCFTTSIPAEPGMSGGFVFVPKDGATVAACGVVCADNSVSESRNDFTVKGESIIGCTWPALALRVPNEFPTAPNAGASTIFDMLRDGRISDVVGDLARIELTDLGSGDCRVHRRPTSAVAQ